MTGITRLNVYMGLAGFYLVRDAQETNLQLPSGKYESENPNAASSPSYFVLLSLRCTAIATSALTL